MKNLLNKLDELEDGSYGRRIRKSSISDLRGWRHYYHNPYRYISPIKASVLLGKHVNEVYNKYAKLLPVRYGQHVNDLLSYLDVAIKAKDGSYVDARGWRGRYSSNLSSIRYILDDNGIIIENPKYKPWRGIRDTRPKYIVARSHAETRAKKRKENRERRKAEANQLKEMLAWVFDDTRRHEIVANIKAKKAKEESDRLMKQWLNEIRARKKK